MLKTHLAAAVVGMILLGSGSALADPPSQECHSGASQCRDAIETLEKCEQAPAKADKKDLKSTANPTGEPPPPASDDPKIVCSAERSAADTACKTSNEVCVRDYRAHPSPPHKD